MASGNIQLIKYVRLNDLNALECCDSPCKNGSISGIGSLLEIRTDYIEATEKHSSVTSLKHRAHVVSFRFAHRQARNSQPDVKFRTKIIEKSWLDIGLWSISNRLTKCSYRKTYVRRWVFSRREQSHICMFNGLFQQIWENGEMVKLSSTDIDS